MTFDEGISDVDWLARLREADDTPRAGRIGPYEQVSEVSRGGQGVVFRARQPGTGRPVALKRIIGGQLASRAARLRFEREVAAVCALSHANIVTVYGVEQIDGQAVLAMEWIDGQPLDAWARNAVGAARPLGERLAVFLQVCSAVQHAHQHGVIHRDLKPTNILVTADGKPHVVDFGLARALSIDDSSAATLTQTAEFLGTPAYAAPEQLGLGNRDIDSRTDVYALGAILYQLLCGRTPYDAARGLPALLEAIRRNEPVPPATVAAGIERDLELITLKALAKEKQQRYQSVDALVADLQRYRAGEPVEAHPASFGYRLQKLVERHRAAFAFVLVVFAMLVGFGAIASTLAWRLHEQRNAAVAAQADEADARAAAEEVSDFLRRMLAAARPRESQGREITVGEIVDEALQQADRSFAGRPAVEATVRLTLGETLYGLGRNAAAQTELEQAVTLLRGMHPAGHEETAWALLHLAHVRRAQGDTARALSFYQEALRAYRDLPAATSGLAATLGSLASLHIERHESDAAERRLHEALEIRARRPEAGGVQAVEDALLLASLQLNRGDRTGAEQHLRTSLELARTALGDRHELTIAVLSNLAVVLKQQGRPAEALPYAEEGLAAAQLVFGENHPHTHKATANMASLLQALERYDEAQALYRTTLQQFAAEQQLDHPTAVAGANNLASLLLKRERYAEAEPLLRETLERARRVFGPQHPNTAMTMGLLATAVREVAPAAGSVEARQLLTDALGIFEAALPPDHPHIRKTREKLAQLPADKHTRP